MPRKNAPIKMINGGKIENGSSSLVNANSHNVSSVINTPNESSSSNRPVRKRKQKLRVTAGENEADIPIPALPTKPSPVESSRKMDYVIPAAITVTTVPLLGAVFYILYKKGRDYWDKRHYRRMDFLINGMYNE